MQRRPGDAQNNWAGNKKYFLPIAQTGSLRFHDIMPVMVQLNSRAIRAVGYDDHYGELYLEFTGGNRGRYLRVPAGHFVGLIESGSPGGYFNRFIRGKYTYLSS